MPTPRSLSAYRYTVSGAALRFEDGEEVHFVNRTDFTGSPQWIYNEHRVAQHLHTVTGHRPNGETITVQARLACMRPQRLLLDTPWLRCSEWHRAGQCPCHALPISRKRRRARSGI